MKNKNIISLIVTILVGFILYYIFLPALNLQSFGFWVYSFILLALYAFTRLVLSLDSFSKSMKVLSSSTVSFAVCVLIVLGIMLTNFILSPLFNSKSYSNRIEINENGEFTTDVKGVDLTQIPLIDKESSMKLGDRVMGQMPEMVSQYYVSDIYTQINYNDSILRVTPLEYNGFFKYLNNKDKGVTGYITVNSVDGTAKLVKLEKGMKYMPSALFSKDLYRHLRFSYPFDIFGRENFEIDNEGNPYWVVPVMKYTGVELKREVSGVIILDPITGESKKYSVKETPTWVDHVYDAELIIEQVDDWGQYKNGFLNSIFSQKNVVMTTEGYNYTVMNDDVYLYTGITSVGNDESNIGFILSNLRTKETNYYAVPGAEEYSAMASAEGQVQQMNYTATFPLLINLNNKPTYLISLKDYAGLVKMYALVDVENYQKVVVTDASLGIEKAVSNYLGEETLNIGENTLSKEIIVNYINQALIDGNTYYYLADSNNNKYKASIKVNKDLLPFVKSGDKIKVYYKSESNVTDIVKLEY